MKRLYFAYGSNMNLEQMAFRCPRAKPLSPAILPDWTLVERLHADIEPAKGASVGGVVWIVTKECLRSLDAYEGVPSYYRRILVDVIMDGCEVPIKILSYRMTERCRTRRDIYQFNEEYARGCVEGAIDNNVKPARLFLQRLTAV